MKIVFKYEPVNFSIRQGKDSEARKFIEMLYEDPKVDDDKKHPFD